MLISSASTKLVEVPPLNSRLKFSGSPMLPLLIPMNTPPITMQRREITIKILPFDMKSKVLRSLPIPNNLILSNPNAIAPFNKNLVITIAVNIDKTIPIANVHAKPFTVPVPAIISTIDAMRVVTLPSTMEEVAFLKPISTALCTVFPVASSSRIRAKMITFASTAIPIDRIIPAIPGKVKVITSLNNDNVMIIKNTYNTSANTLTKPGKKYTATINTATRIKPITAACKQVVIASEPSCAPTTLERNSCNSSFNAPLRMLDARRSASSAFPIPLITACPSLITTPTRGTLINLSS